MMVIVYQTVIMKKIRTMPWEARGNYMLSREFFIHINPHLTNSLFLLSINNIYSSCRYVGQSPTARMVSHETATHYKMDHKQRGIALIFNHEHFTVTGLRPRSGTQTDCHAFKTQLKKLGFEVIVYSDLNYHDLQDNIITASRKDHSNYDCFLLAVLTHGEMNILYAKDTPYKPESLWHPFTADKCPTLAGKNLHIL